MFEMAGHIDALTEDTCIVKRHKLRDGGTFEIAWHLDPTSNPYPTPRSTIEATPSMGPRPLGGEEGTVQSKCKLTQGLLDCYGIEKTSLHCSESFRP